MAWLSMLLVAAGVRVASAQGANATELEVEGSKPYKDKGYELDFDNTTSTLTKETAKNLRKAFFEAYPQECDTFNSGCAKKVTIRVEPKDVLCGKDDKGKDVYALACAVGPLITVSGTHIEKNPQDYDLITHEAMHVVQQGYQDTSSCTYWHEGLADVARSRFGINNKAQGWKLVKGKSYKDSYVQTAHFLEWVETKYTIPLAESLDAELRKTGCPTDTFWKAQTTLGVDELWKAYDTGATTPKKRNADPSDQDGATEPSDSSEIDETEDTAENDDGTWEETDEGDDSSDTDEGDDSWSDEGGDDSWSDEESDDSWSDEGGDDSWSDEESDDSWSDEGGDDSWDTEEVDDTSEDE